MYILRTYINYGIKSSDSQVSQCVTKKIAARRKIEYLNHCVI